MVKLSNVVLSIFTYFRGFLNDPQTYLQFISTLLSAVLEDALVFTFKNIQMSVNTENEFTHTHYQ